VAEPRSRPVLRVGRCGRSMRPSPHSADAVTQNRRALADAASVVLDTDTTSWYSMRHRLVDIDAVCCRVDGQELTTFQRCIDPERPKPPDVHQGTASRLLGPGSTHARACPPTVQRVLVTPDTLLLANTARFDLRGDRCTMRHNDHVRMRIATTRTTNHDAARGAGGTRYRV
jgi:hypothetical protein